MSRHSFDPDIAAKVGLNAAVIYQNIVWWCEKNTANDENRFEGRHWTYNSIKAFCDLFPYLTENQIRTALDKLETDGLILSGNFNKSAYDRTKWFCPAAQIHLGKNPNGNGKKPKPIPDSKPDNKPDITPSPIGSDDLFAGKGIEPNGSTEALNPSQHSETTGSVTPREDEFETFWKAFPAGRKVDKPKARVAFWAIVQGKNKAIPKTPAEMIIAGAVAYARTSPDPQFVPMPMTWLRGARWEAQDPMPPVARASTYHGEVVR